MCRLLWLYNLHLNSEYASNPWALGFCPSLNSKQCNKPKKNKGLLLKSELKTQATPKMQTQVTQGFPSRDPAVPGCATRMHAEANRGTVREIGFSGHVPPTDFSEVHL